MPLRKNTDNVLSVVDDGKARVKNLGLEVPKAVIRYADNSEEKIGKPNIIVLTNTPPGVHRPASIIALEPVNKFVRASSMRKPFC